MGAVEKFLERRIFAQLKLSFLESGPTIGFFAMAQNVLTPAVVTSSRFRILRNIGAIGLALLVILLAGIAWLLSIARSAVPQVDGPLPVAGISAPVSIIRDNHGVPTIESATLDDLFFAQGYVTAQDRLFQMDLMRRAATGELSEIVGEVAVKHDRGQRILETGCVMTYPPA